jgi:polysaccharide export outer membrane protein
MNAFQKREMLRIVVLLATLVSVGCQTTASQSSPDQVKDHDWLTSSGGFGLFTRPVTPLERNGLQNRPVIAPVPKELVKTCMPDYRVEPPDILWIDAVRAIPKPPYKAEPLDVLFVSLANPLPTDPLTGLSSIETDGTINLGVTYGGSVSVLGLTLAEIKTKLEQHLRTAVGMKDPRINVSLSQARASQRISGQHLVRPDGTIGLGTYGSVRVVGMTLAEVRKAVEAQLSNYLLNPEVSVDVLSYNSKIYYVVLDGGGAGQTIMRMPITGNETVLDAIAEAKGLATVSSKDRIWVSRPAPEGAGHQLLPVNWKAVVELGDTATNYQIMPGDRVYVAAYPLSTLDNYMARVISPMERFFGILLLGSNAVQTTTYPLGIIP